MDFFEKIIDFFQNCISWFGGLLKKFWFWIINDSPISGLKDWLLESWTHFSGTILSFAVLGIIFYAIMQEMDKH